MRPPGYRAGFGSVRQRVASKVAYGTFHPRPPGYRPGFNSGRPGATAQVSPAAAPAPGGTVAPVTPQEAPQPPGHDATYNAGIADVIQTRKGLTAKLASAYTNNTADSTTGANKAGLLHSSTLANKLAELKTNYENDQGDVDARYGTGDNYGISGGTLLGEEQQRHAGDPLPTTVDDPTLQSLNQPANAASPHSTVHLASGWTILYGADNKPIKFLPPGQKA